MRKLRWLMLTPSAAGIILCLAALSAGAPALAAQDAYGLSQVTTMASHVNERTHAYPRRKVSRLAVRVQRIERARRIARRKARAAAAAQAAAAAAAAQAQAPVVSPATEPAQPSVSTGGMAAFEACVISRESGGNPTAYNPASGAGGLFQFLPSTWANTPEGPGYPGGAQTAPAGVQEQAFAWVYAREGTSPWAPYDGC
jgi:Transglycosylase-like domain